MAKIEIIKQILDKGEPSFYLIDADKFKKNFQNLLFELNSIFPHFNIAYSYKTNYSPTLCKIVKQLGGYAEVVSWMEYEIALRIGEKPKKIIFNGPVKDRQYVYQMLSNGGSVNIDNIYELKDIETHFRGHKTVRVALRCNYPTCDGVTSRFGIDVASEEFKQCLNIISSSDCLQLIGIHAHIANRGLDVWADKVNGLCNVLQRHNLFDLEFVDFGGGLYGNMPQELKNQFDSYIPSFEEYAKVIAPPIKNLFNQHPNKKIPTILIEPGSAVVGDAMDFICTVDSIKDIRGKKIATVTGSMYNINPTLNHKNPPIEILGKKEDGTDCFDIAGFTCIESDYLYKGYKGKLNVGDTIVFGNVGSYSIVLKPPFILPNFPIYQTENGRIYLAKEKETFNDIFHTYNFL